MPDQQKLFRKAALDRLSSPEQLDRLMQVTTPKGWIALIALGALLFIAIVWGVFGRVPTQVNGMGILIRKGGVYDVEAPATGVITRLHKDTGELVKEGELVAELAQPDLANEVEKAKKNLENLKKQQAQSKSFNDKDLEMQRITFEKQIENQNFNIDSSRQKVKWIEERIQNQEELFEKGLITKQQLLQTREEKAQTLDTIQIAQNKIKQLQVQKEELVQKYKAQALDYSVKISEAEKNVHLLEKQYDTYSKVTSPYTGTVLSVLYDEGTQVLKGNAIFNIELTGKQQRALDAIVYVGPTKGKMIRPDMVVQVSPTNVKKEKYGFIIGKVRTISEFPASKQEMKRMLKNDDLVQTLAVGGAPYSVEVDLQEDPNTYSNLKWSSGKGPQIKVHTGTLTVCQIVTKEERPITLVIPAFKKFLGL